MPAEVKFMPFQLYGNDDGQTLNVVVLLSIVLMLKINVATESQALDPVNVESIYVPAVVKLLPFQRYGNIDGHTASAVILLSIILTVKINVATESQPPPPINVESI